MEQFLTAARTFHERHERLKKSVHTAWRYPLPKWGRMLAGAFYFSVPVVGGWFVMQWAIGKSHESIDERGEKLKIKEVRGLGDTAIIDGRETKVGAGGLYGGVKLAVSDKEDQERSRAMLEALLKKEEKKRQRKERAKEEENTG